MKNRDNILDALHKIQIEILDEIVKICDKHDITYFLCTGTLLGAIRHKGFVPWDDDIDICMPRKEYTKFAEICKEELQDGFLLQDWHTEPLHYLTFAKVKKIDTIYKEKSTMNLPINKGVFVDIFILDNVEKKNSAIYKLQKYFHDKVSSYLRLKIIVKSYEKKTRRQKLGTDISESFKYKMHVFLPKEDYEH